LAIDSGLSRNAEHIALPLLELLTVGWNRATIARIKTLRDRLSRQPKQFMRRHFLSIPMNVKILPPLFRCGFAGFLALLIFVLPAHAGNIFFGLSINGNTITLTNQGNSSAYYPVVMRLLPDGRWEPLAPPAGIAPSAELASSAHIDFIWPTATAQQKPFPLDIFRPIMVRFFDQAGNGFGQISFFTQPSVTSDLSESRYENGLMTIAPPRNEGGVVIGASWLLWPQEEGIAPLNAPVTFKHKQPPARRIEWKPGMDKLHLNLGAGLPSAILLHEVGGGYAMQNLISGGVQGVQQRTSWLDASGPFYNWAEGIAAVAIIVMLWCLFSAWRKKVAQ
jgi:hypothetical protein